MAGGFNAINILFRLTAEDNLTGGFNKAKSAMATLDEQAGKLQMSMTKVNAAMDGMDPAMVSKVTESLDGTDMATQRWNADLNKVIAKMREVGATSEQMQTVAGKLTTMREQEDKNVVGLSGMRSGISGIAIAAGAAFTMAGYYLENFVQECIKASTTIQQQNMEIGASMGLNAVQSIQQGPAIQQMLSNTEAATGQNVQQLRAITPSVGLVAGGNMQLTQNDLEAISAMTYARQGSGATLSGISGVYNKMVTSGATNPLSQMGISLEDMGMTRTEFQKLSPEERQNVINNAVLGKLGFMNSDVAGTTGAQLQVFQGRLTQFMADLGDSFLPTMNVAMDVLEGIFHIAEGIPGLMPVIGVLLLAITAVTLVLGPLLIMIQLFDADAIASMFMMASSGIEALNLVMIPYLEGLTTRIAEEGLLPALQWLYAESISGVSIASIYATSKEWLLAASQMAVGKEGVAAGAGVLVFSGAVRDVIVALIAWTGIGAILPVISGYISLIGEAFMSLITPTEALAAAGEGSLGAGLVTVLSILAGILGIADAVLSMGNAFKSGKAQQANKIPGGIVQNEQWWNPLGKQDVTTYFDPFKKYRDSFVKTFSKLPGEAYNWGKSILTSFVKGIEDSIPKLSAILKVIADHFPHSPPKIGPLATITGENFTSWMTGLFSGAGTWWNNMMNDNYNRDEKEAAYWNTSGGLTTQPPTAKQQAAHAAYLTAQHNSGLQNVGSNVNGLMNGAINYITHGPISIDASHMTPDELMAMMTYICEKYLLPSEGALPAGPTATKTSTTNKTSTTPAQTVLGLPTVGGLLPPIP